MVAIRSLLFSILAVSIASTSALPTASKSERGLAARTFGNSGFYNCIEFGIGRTKFCKCVETWNYNHKRDAFPMSPALELEVRGTELEGRSHDDLEKRTFEIQRCTIPARGYQPVFLTIGGCCEDPCKSSCGSKDCCTGGEVCQSGVPVKPPKHGHGHWKRSGVAQNVDLTRCPTGGDKQNVHYEYLDVKSNIESCGGCVFPDPASKSSNTTALGQDCTSLPNVADVACKIGSCIIKSCERGFTLQNNQCVPDVRKALQMQKYRL